MDACATRSSSTIMLSPPCDVMACSSAAALAAFRVVSTTKKPSLANFWAMAPPTPQRMPTGRSLSSSTLPCASWVLRPSACHLEVAPTTTATGLRVAFIVDSFLSEVDYTHGSRRSAGVGRPAPASPATWAPVQWESQGDGGRGFPLRRHLAWGNGDVDRRLPSWLSGRLSQVDAPGGSHAPG